MTAQSQAQGSVKVTGSFKRLVSLGSVFIVIPCMRAVNRVADRRFRNGMERLISNLQLPKSTISWPTFIKLYWSRQLMLLVSHNDLLIFMIQGFNSGHPWFFVNLHFWNSYLHLLVWAYAFYDCIERRWWFKTIILTRKIKTHLLWVLDSFILASKNSCFI